MLRQTESNNTLFLLNDSLLNSFFSETLSYIMIIIWNSHKLVCSTLTSLEDLVYQNTHLHYGAKVGVILTWQKRTSCDCQSLPSRLQLHPLWKCCDRNYINYSPCRKCSSHHFPKLQRQFERSYSPIKNESPNPDHWSKNKYPKLILLPCIIRSYIDYKIMLSIYLCLLAMIVLFLSWLITRKKLHLLSRSPETSLEKNCRSWSLFNG